MLNYKHILVAIDLHPNFDQIAAKRALEMATVCKAKLTIVHAVEHINAYGIAQAYPSVFELEQELLTQAKDELAKLCEHLKIDAAEVVVEVGSPKLVILDTVKRVNADLIVVGSHGRHGISILLGSTANAVLHHATCDVLAVRLKND
jgi:universal stress protein A